MIADQPADLGVAREDLVGSGRAFGACSTDRPAETEFGRFQKREVPGDGEEPGGGDAAEEPEGDERG